jgi:predicted nucleic acid-binding protein
MLVHLALTHLFQARWSETIHDEWIRNVLEARPDVTREQLERTRSLMNKAVPDSVVTGYEKLVQTLSLPDPDDRHVLAAAIHTKAEIIVTFNVRDFPASVLSSYGIEACKPDAFVLRLLDAYPVETVAALRKQRAALKKPPQTVVQFLDIISKQGLPFTVAKLREYEPLL